MLTHALRHIYSMGMVYIIFDRNDTRIDSQKSDLYWALIGMKKVNGLTEHIMPYNMPELDKRFRIHHACMYSADDTAHVLHGKN